MKVELVTADPARKIVLDTLPAMIGRDATAEVNVEDSFVATYHSILDQEGDTLKVLRLGSKTGTFVNGHRMKGAAVLMPGDRLTVGRTTFVVQYDRRPSPVLSGNH
jgi:pSer/pThr/pTyr-binding forkhead associated (FHA) protein